MGHSILMAAISAVLATGMVPPAHTATSTDVQSIPVSKDLTAKKQRKGALKVSVTGSGTYTVKGRHFRKTADSSRTFRVKPGKYKVQASGATVKPKPRVTVRMGETRTVRVLFPSPKTTTPKVTPQPTASPSPPPPSSAPSPTPSSGPSFSRSVTLQPGSSVQVDLSPDLASLESLSGPSSDGPVSWYLLDGQLWLAAASDTGVEQRTVLVNGAGCRSDQDCGLPARVEITVSCRELEAPHEVEVTEFTEASPDRSASAKEIGFGLSQLRDEILVTIGSPGSPGSRTEADAAASTVGAVVSAGMQDIGVYELRWAAPPPDLQASLDALNAIPEVHAAPSTYGGWSEAAVLTPMLLPPHDWDDDGPEGRWHLDQIHAPDAWDMVTGNPAVRVGVVEDDRIRRTHEDLSVVWVGGPAKVDNHATHVAGLACANANGKGVVGVSWSCPLVSSTYKPDSGSKQIMEAVRQGIRQGARIVNMSTGAAHTEDVDHDGFKEGTCLPANMVNEYRSDVYADKWMWRALMDGAARNVLFTVAAGNACAPMAGSPWGANGDLYNVLTVAATNSNHHLASFSNFGDGVEIAAPGGVYLPINMCGLWSTIATADNAYRADTYCGTSMAAPIVAGIASLTWAKNPDFDARELGACITSGATETVTTRDLTIPKKTRNPVFTYAGNLPLVDARAVINCRFL